MDGSIRPVWKLFRPTFLFVLHFLVYSAIILLTTASSVDHVAEKHVYSSSSHKTNQKAQSYLKEISSILEHSSSQTSSQLDYIVTYPARVDHQRNFLSHKVSFFPQESNPRRKRDLSDDEDQKNIFITVNMGRKEVTLNLTENTRIVHPNFVVERLRPEEDEEARFDGSPPHRSSIKLGTSWPCHFRGYVIDHPNSSVALSTCNGLTGLIRLDEGDYFIEPMVKSYDDAGFNKKQAHKVYKRDASRQQKAEEKSSQSDADKEVDLEPENSFVSEALHRRSRHKTDDFRHHDGRMNGLSKLFDINSQAENTTSQHFPAEFCGVKDTRRQYERDLRARKSWEKRRKQRAPIRLSEKQRKKRSLSLEHWVEMMVVVDRKMVEYYELYHEEEVERYVLTIVNMVSGLFHDWSIGNSLHITLIRLILLEGDERSIVISQHAEKTLESFCRWAKRMNPRSDNHANHHDVAVLLTRKNICSNSNTSCETLGLAHVAGMCQSHRSCNVNQDTGLSLAFTVAHELGHNFAMHHDGQLNECEPDNHKPRVMSPHLTSNNLPMRWSRCSRRYITRFLDRNWGFCLMDMPSVEHDQFNFPKHLPGVLYNADHQCRLMFGPRSKHCKGIDDICNRLWCVYQGTCRSRLHAAVAGTKCGKGRWCYGGKCVPFGRSSKSSNGGWGPWTKWSRCSRTCGVGISYSARYCNRPVPRNGGRYCLGERRRYRTCNTWKCPKSNTTLTFREQQCAEFNNVLYRNHSYSWLAVESAIYPCELHCYTNSSKTPFADRLRDKVVDGTKCFTKNHAKDICVDGICKRLGCDLKIDSMAREDKCGVCRGDGSTCTEIESSFDVKRGNEYEQVGLLPMGARNIKVVETRPSLNYLALKSPVDNDYYLNGNYTIQWDFMFELAGTTFTYQRINKTLDNITAEGPLTHDLMVMVLFLEDNPGINISYVMPNNVTAVLLTNDDPPQFQWMRHPWSSCSRTCGKGIQISKAICVEKKAGIVEEDFCSPNSRPGDRRRICVNPRCPAEWLTGPWLPCSVTCGGGIGRQKRTVLCIRSINDIEQIVLNRTKCSKLRQPKRTRSCLASSQLPCPVWRAGPWGQCSQTCGSGIQNRIVNCVTYVINDVISLGDEDMDSRGENYHVEPAMVDAGDPSSNRSHIPGPNELVTLNKITILQRRKEQNLLESVDFDIESDDACVEITRPHDKEPCNLGECSEIKPADHTILPSYFENLENAFDMDFSPDTDPVVVTKEILNQNEGNHTDLLDVENTTNIATEITLQNVTFKEDDLLENTNALSNFAPSRTWSFISANETRTHHLQTEVYQHFNDGGSGKGLLEDDIHLINGNIKTSTTSTTTTSTTTTSVTSTSTESTSPTIPPKWLIGLWGQCSTTCGVGARIRNVICSAGPERCDDTARPAPAQRCNLKPCARWQYGGWSKCSRPCGSGLKRLKVHCRDSRTDELLRPYHCSSSPKLPVVNKTCNARQCLPWKTSRWSQCNVTCGTGMQRRRIACSRRGWCNPNFKPAHIKNCMPRKCVEWRTSAWSRCSVNCGNGQKRRVVECIEKETDKRSDACDSLLIPKDVQKCNEEPCRVTDFDFSSCTGDRLKTKFCRVLRTWGKCVQPSLAIQCCATCKTFLNVRRHDKIS
ncbi:A disintegrin and metalloproteinase with thrombospondin motifs 7-like isoform X2 [Clavelina lepadiformis]|uniref:A disintegrin and metalloproteinase with thrombospondin motifs 7-like isoform X2 n=1 Tax=Clavelina lepadiformis TaxID=159417 RepID=UPI004041C5CE